MWSKTRQILKSKLADSLKDRVDYHYDVYRTNKCRKIKVNWWSQCTEMHVLSIIVDDAAWFCTNPKYYWLKGCGPDERTKEDVIRETGYVGCEWGYTVTEFIHEYLNELSIDEAFTHDNYFIRLLAVLDKRVGKRRLRPLLDNIENEPEWFRKWIRLRCEAEGMCGEHIESEDVGQKQEPYKCN